ncbi:hypothetical protein FB446DRAFT_794262 [Lentinula raphanica]|nr:hypothetical protein FB446DRAFT_794262 [Lentinula raphanica]
MSNDALIDSASRLGSTKKRKLTKAQWRTRLAPAFAARKNSPAEEPESESDEDDGDKENDIDEVLELKKGKEALRKRSAYWKKKAGELREASKKKRKEEEEKRREEKSRGKEMHRSLKKKDDQIQELKEELERERKRRRIEDEAQTQLRESLYEQLHDKQHQLHILQRRVLRIPERLATAANRATRAHEARVLEEQKFYFKDSNGTIPDNARDVFLDLVSVENVPLNKVARVVKRIASLFGIEVEGDVSRRSVGRIVNEGGLASKLQFIDALKDAKGVTISGDGTTHKNETYESKFATVITPETRIQFFLGIKMAVNHTSETQLAGWIESIEEFFDLAYESKLVSEDDTRIFWNLVTGFHSDHAADQKKLFTLMKNWKQQLDREERGQRAIKNLSDNEYACLVFQGAQALIQKAGGPTAWERLSLEERTHRIAEMKKHLKLTYFCGPVAACIKR